MFLLKNNTYFYLLKTCAAVLIYHVLTQQTISKKAINVFTGTIYCTSILSKGELAQNDEMFNFNRVKSFSNKKYVS